MNVRLFARGMLVHAVTRVYFPDEAANETDPVLASVERARRPSLVARPVPSEGTPRYLFDIRLQGEDETVFFDV